MKLTHAAHNHPPGMLRQKHLKHILTETITLASEPPAPVMQLADEIDDIMALADDHDFLSTIEDESLHIGCIEESL